MTLPQSMTAEEQLRHAAELLHVDASAAAAQLNEMLKANPLNADAYRLLAEAKETIHRRSSHAVNLRSLTVSAANIRLGHAAQALEADDLPTAEIILRARLLDQPTDVQALRMMAELAARLGYKAEGIDLLRLALELAPDSPAIRFSLAAILHRANRSAEAIDLLEALLTSGGDDLRVRSLLASALVRAGRFDDGVAAYQRTLERFPREARTWMHYGHLLRTMGRLEKCAEALRRSVEIAPESGVVWWSLSDMKSVRLSHSDIDRIATVLRRDEEERT